MHPIYNQYPMMVPHVGKNYVRGGKASLLLIGESHYLPDYSTQHQTASHWYAGHWTTLNDEERFWINTSELIAHHRNQKFRNRGVSIWRNSFSVINEHGPRYEDYKQVADAVVFYNYFLRPAETGKSLHVEMKDLAIANEVFTFHYGEFQPSAVVFLSRLAYRDCQALDQVSVPMVATPHPGCAHWNRPSMTYGNKRGRDLLAGLCERLDWTTS